jgi:hypothetical protein
MEGRRRASHSAELPYCHRVPGCSVKGVWMRFSYKDEDEGDFRAKRYEVDLVSDFK